MPYELLPNLYSDQKKQYIACATLARPHLSDQCDATNKSPKPVPFFTNILDGDDRTLFFDEV